MSLIGRQLGFMGGQGAGSGNDPYFSNVSLLLHMNGTNGSTTFTDSSSNAITVTPSGSAQLTTTNPKFGTACGKFVTASSDGISAASSAVFNFGTGDFTIECWVKSTYTFGSYLASLNIVTGLALRMNWVATDQIEFQVGGVQILNSSTMTNISDGNWHHIALTRSGTTVTWWYDGTSSGTTTSSASVGGSGNPLVIGMRSDGVQTYTCNLDDFRITKGVARYTTNFTPPSIEFPDS